MKYFLAIYTHTYVSLNKLIILVKILFTVIDLANAFNRVWNLIKYI